MHHVTVFLSVAVIYVISQVLLYLVMYALYGDALQMWTFAYLSAAMAQCCI